MEEKLNDLTIDLLLGGIERKLNEVKTEFKWKELFVKTGSFLIDNTDKLKSFENDLFIVFSKDNMKAMANKLKDKRGYEFPQLLYNELYDLIVRYEIKPLEAESYIHHFSQVIIKYLEDNDSDKTLEIYLGRWKKEAEIHFRNVESKLDLILSKITDLEKIEISSFSIADIDVEIRKESKYKGMGLSFFELDDEQFEIKMQNYINDERIYVVGKSREEAIYRILNELNKKTYNRITLVIKSESEWERLNKADLSGHILIPFFLAERIVAIPNNTNIFVYSEDEPCYNRDKLILRKRTKKSIIHSLEQIGIDGSMAYKMVDNTHGLYVPLKKKLFNGAIYNKPTWTECYSEVVMAALLCGKWVETDGDKLILEELSGKDYNECKKELENYTHREYPFVVSYRGYTGSNMQLASVEDAWEELDVYISNDMWENFIKLLYEVLIESEPIFDYPFEKHFEASVYAEKPVWSPTLKMGMIRTLIMRAYYRGHAEYQRQIDNVVEKILKTITNKERWGYISQYIKDLCEASPRAVLWKLEEEFQNPTGLLELFAVNDGDFITGRHYYTHVLWAVEQLLQQKKYAVRAVEWLLRMNSNEIKYSISNSPKGVLEVIFCAWINVSVLTTDSKINLARKAIDTYKGGWEIILSKLPSGGGSICSTLNTPQYRGVDEPEELYMHEVNRTYIEYLRMCVNAIDTDANKWKKIIEHLHWYDENIKDEVIEKLIHCCRLMNDQERIQIKNEIRQIIYRHRYFKNSDWSMEDIQVQKYESLLNIIVLENPVYEYLYLFSPAYEYPLLNPVIFNREDNSKNSRDENKVMREKEIKLKMNSFKNENYSLETLVELAVKNEKSILGEVLAQFYCEEKYDEAVLVLLLKKDKEGKHVYDYARVLVQKKAVDLSIILDKVKEFTNRENLIVNLISLQVIENSENAIIANEHELIKKDYWSRGLRVSISANANEEVCIWALNECHKFGILSSYVELLFDLREKLQDIQIYQYFLMVEDMGNNIPNSMTEYYFEVILDTVQKSFGNDEDKCQKIATLEWRCRNILEWEQMKCMQHIMKSDPTIYAGLVGIIYRTDENSGEDGKKVDLIHKIYDGFNKAKFCPAEKDGKVIYNEIKEWLDKFKELLAEQKQDRLFENMVGRLLAYSPVGQDGYMPCEEVRKIIEENYSESLKRSYVIAEQNKRGVHTVDAGKAERKLHEKYRSNAEALQYEYPRTAEIYFTLSDSYENQAEWERRRSEDEW